MTKIREDLLKAKDLILENLIKYLTYNNDLKPIEITNKIITLYSTARDFVRVSVIIDKYVPTTEERKDNLLESIKSTNGLVIPNIDRVSNEDLEMRLLKIIILLPECGSLEVVKLLGLSKDVLDAYEQLEKITITKPKPKKITKYEFNRIYFDPRQVKEDLLNGKLSTMDLVSNGNSRLFNSDIMDMVTVASFRNIDIAKTMIFRKLSILIEYNLVNQYIKSILDVDTTVIPNLITLIEIHVNNQTIGYSESSKCLLSDNHKTLYISWLNIILKYAKDINNLKLVDQIIELQVKIELAGYMVNP